jgi:CrcB protein
MKGILFVALGGAIGSLARYGVYVFSVRLWGPAIPWGTLGANVVGCLIIGALAGAADSRLALHPDIRLFLMTGILGGFTTFSAFSLDFVRLLESQGSLVAGGYVAASVGLSIGGAILGLVLARALGAL